MNLDQIRHVRLPEYAVELPQRTTANTDGVSRSRGCGGFRACGGSVRRLVGYPVNEAAGDYTMVDSSIEMMPAIGSDGEPIYCAADPETPPAQPPLLPRAPLLEVLLVLVEVLLVLGAGLVLLALSARVK